MAIRDAAKTLSRNPEPMETAPLPVTQSKRPELGRYLLQVDRQTKGSYPSAEAAEKAGLAIKIGHPVVQVVVYDAVQCVGKIVELAKS
jgi:hypothetical protein